MTIFIRRFFIIAIRVLPGVLGMWMAGCPSFVISDSTIRQSSRGRFTVLTTLTVTEEEADKNIDETGRELSGRAEIAVWAPDGWELSAARLTEISTGHDFPLAPVTPTYPVVLTFPRVAGKQASFLTECATSANGTRVFRLEMDVSSNGLMTGSLGILVNVFQKTDNTIPTEIRIDLDRNAAEILPVDEQNASTPSDQWPTCPARAARVTPGQRGCSCTAPGAFQRELEYSPSILKLLLF